MDKSEYLKRSRVLNRPPGGYYLTNGELYPGLVDMMEGTAECSVCGEEVDVKDMVPNRETGETCNGLCSELVLGFTSREALDSWFYDGKGV